MATIEEPVTHTFDAKSLLSALTALKRGDFTVRLPGEWTGLGGKVADAFNEVIDRNERMHRELGRSEPRGRQRRDASASARP